MAQTEHLPILRYALRATQDRSERRPIALSSERQRAYRRVGQDLRDGARRVLRLVVRANARGDKASVLFELREEVEELEVLARLCHDTKAFANFNSFEHAISLVTSVARQNEGWLKSQQQGRGPLGAGQNRRVILKEVAEPSVP